MLQPEQQAAINSVFGQYVLPMPGTLPADGLVICDALTASNFKPEVMGEYGIGWPIIGMWNYEGNTVVSLDKDELQKRLPEGGLLHEPHRWSGWPKIKEFSDEVSDSQPN